MTRTHLTSAGAVCALVLHALAGSAGAGALGERGAAAPGGTDTARAVLAEADGRLVRLAPIDAPALAEAERLSQRPGRPLRFAVPAATDLGPWTHGVVTDLGDGRVEWALDVEAPGARSINFGTDFARVPGVTLYLLDAQGAMIGEPYDASHSVDGQLWTRLVPGDFAQIVVEAPKASFGAFAETFRVRTINAAFLDVMGVSGGLGLRSASCHVDVACDLAAPYPSQVSSVGRIVTGGVSLCSGVLLNNTAQDGTPYFLTAHHCDSWTNPAAVVVYWNYQNSTCRAPGSAASGASGDGSFAQTTSGAALRMTNPEADSTLLRLAQAPNPAWGVDYAGWDATGAADDAGAFAVHHPSGQEKRISLDNEPIVQTFAALADQPNIRVWRTQFDYGGVQSGSSGGALFSRAGRVIGVATGVDTLTACFPQRTYFGRFDHAWNAGATSASRLRDWLDPQNTGALRLDPLNTDIPSPDNFALLSPASGETGVALNATFRWAPSAGAEGYRVVIDNDPDLSSDALIEAFVTGTSWTPPPGLLEETLVYYWGVFAVNTYEDTPSTPAVASFKAMTDCDGSGMDDALEIALGLVEDCDGNGRPDSCDLRAGPVELASDRVGPIGAGSPVEMVLFPAPRAVSPVTLAFEAFADISSQSEHFTISLNGQTLGDVFRSGYFSDCDFRYSVDALTIGASTWNALVDAHGGMAIVRVTASSQVGAQFCNGSPTVRCVATYDAEPLLADLDNSGRPDMCETPCSEADVSTDGGAAQSPDGLVNLTDFVAFLEWWAAEDARADITDADMCAFGTGGDGVKLSDFSCFVTVWADGCP